MQTKPELGRNLSDILSRSHDDLRERLWRYLDPLLEADRHHGSLDLVHPGSLEAEIETVVGEGADLGVLSIVANADDGNTRGFNQLD